MCFFKSSLIEDVKIKDYMTREPIHLKESDSLQYAAKVFYKNKIDSVVVYNDTCNIVGIFTKSNLLAAVSDNVDLKKQIKYYMENNIHTIQENSYLEESIQLAWTYGIGRLPVVDEKQELVGMWTQTNLIRAFRNKASEMISRYEAILGSVNYGIVAIDKSDQIIYINKIAEEFFNIKFKDVKNKNIKKIVPACILPSVARSGKAVHNEKKIIWGRVFIANFCPITDFANKEIVGALAVFQDISTAEKISKELNIVKRIMAEYDTLFESSFDGITLSDENGNLLRINAAFRRITGINTDYMIGKNVQDLMRDGIIDKVVTFKELSSGKPVTIVQKLNTGKQLLVTSIPLIDENTGRIISVVSNFRDLNELNNLRKELEEINLEKQRVLREVTQLRARRLSHDNIVAESTVMKKIVDLALKVSEVDTNVLITGETGVGKEVVAQFIHKNSNRKYGPFIKINCGAYPENLIESEIFGYEKGAFTGANKEGKPGVFEMANEGTLFMDEVGELPPQMAVGLLHILQDKHLRRLGGTNNFHVDVRIISATNANLESLIEEKVFRQDLYYRLNVINIHIPPLRERVDDIPFLTIKTLKRLNKKYNLNKRISSATMDYLLKYLWPGNVRELENILERIVVLSDSDVITEKSIPNYVKNQEGQLISDDENTERDELISFYDKYRSTRKIAKLLGCHQSTIVRKLNKYGIMGLYKSDEFTAVQNNLDSRRP